MRWSGLFAGAFLAALTFLSAPPAIARGSVCDRNCLERIGGQYRTAYLAHDRRRAPFAASVRFTENNVAMPLPDGTWDTVTREVGSPLTVVDPTKGSVGIFTAIMQGDVPGFLAIRLKILGRKIVEVEHVVATARYLAPPVTLGAVEGFSHDPDFVGPAMSAEERVNRADLVRMANGYFSTLEKNDGTLHTRFADKVSRLENGTRFPDVEKGFRNGFYRFNERVRDRDFFLVDEMRGIVMARAYIDHKGQVGRYRLTDGTEARSPYQEPQTWGVIEMFRISKAGISAIEAIFVQLPYYMPSPWSGERLRASTRHRP